MDSSKTYLINWIGGKRLLRKTIKPLIPENISSYIEPFGGGAWILFYQDKWADLEVYNDLNENLVNLFRIVKYHPEALVKEFRWMIASRKMFYDYKGIDVFTDIQKAARFMYIISRSFGGKGEHFGIGKTGSSGACKSQKNILARIELVSERLDRVTIENQSYERLLELYDNPDTFFYCDPPYIKGDTYYETVKDGFNHKQLRDCIKNIQGRFLLSYDDEPLVRELYKDYHIIAVERQKGINKNTAKDHVFKEVLITNYDVIFQEHTGMWYAKDNFQQTKQIKLFT